MSENSKPDLNVEVAARLYAASLTAAQTEPLRIPPGCDVPVESLSLVIDAPVGAAPVETPPGLSLAGDGKPSKPPPRP